MSLNGKFSIIWHMPAHSCLACLLASFNCQNRQNKNQQPSVYDTMQRKHQRGGGWEGAGKKYGWQQRAGYMCSLNRRVKLVSRVTSERDGVQEMETQDRTSPKCCKLEKRQLMVNDNFSVAQRQVNDEHTCSWVSISGHPVLKKMRGHTSKQTLRTASYSSRTEIAWHLKDHLP